MENLKNFLRLWGKTFLKAILIGFLVFILLGNFTKIANALFLGLFISYMIIGAAISNLPCATDFVYNFCHNNFKIAVIMIVISILSFIFFSTIVVITWPLLISGISLFVASILGGFANYSENTVTK